MTIVLESPKHRLLASAAKISVLVAGLTAATFATAQEQAPRQGGATAAEELPEITVQAPRSRTRRQAAAPEPASQPASLPPAPNPNSTMTPPPVFPGDQVARGGQVGVLGNLDYMNTPFSTTNFTQTFIENRQFTTIQDVMLSDPSVSFAQSGSRLANDYVRIRGFADYSGQDAAAINGLVGVSSYYLPSPEFLSRLELLKGPNAFLNGAPGAVGGSINLVTKRATDKPILDITATYGSESQWGGIVDIGGRYGDNKQFGLRVNAFHRDGDLQMRGYSGKQEGAAVGWDYRGERLRLDADLIYRNHIFYGDPYYSTLADPEMGLPQAPNPKINLTPPWMFMAAKALIVMTRAEFDLNDNWTIAAAYGRSKSDDTFGGYCFNVIANIKGDATCGGGYFHSQYDRDAANLALRGNFVTGALKHRLIIGGNYIGEEQGSQPNLPAMPTIDFNIYNPVWPAAFPEPAFGDRNKQNTFITRGSFITHMVSTVDDRISVIGGLRRTQIDQTNFDIVTGQQLSGSSAAEVTPSIAGLVKITPWLALYGNYIEALERGGVAPPTAVNAGQSFPALVSKQHEFGAKFDFQTLGATFAYYNINKANQYLDASTNIFTQNGRQENRGYEVTIFGEPIKGIRFVAGAAFIDAVQLQTDGGEFDGKKVTSVPESEYRLTAEVDLPSVPGFTVTGAIYHTGPAPYDNANTFDVPSWTRFDLGGRYVYYVDQVKMTARFNVENLTNEAYWIAGYGSGGLAQSGARRYVASLTASF